MKLVKPTGDAQRATQTTVDTIEISKKLAASWKSPPFQRELKNNSKVQALVPALETSGILPGMLTLGVLDGDVYTVDGQHRLSAFLMSSLVAIYADVRTHYFTSLAEMAEEYRKLNSALVRMRPDDILKALEVSNPHLRTIRQKCNWVGYDSIRRGTNAPILSMSTVLRVWAGSRNEVPQLAGEGATIVATALDEFETGKLIEFLTICFSAWRRDLEYRPLWGALNLILCAWVYRRVVTGDLGKAKRTKPLDSDQFRRCLLSVSAHNDYIEYLVGRHVSERDRAPAYGRLKAIFSRRYSDEHKGEKLLLPSPPWATNPSGSHGPGVRLR